MCTKYTVDGPSTILFPLPHIDGLEAAVLCSLALLHLPAPKEERTFRPLPVRPEALIKHTDSEI